MVKICHFVDTLEIGGLEKTVKNIVLGMDKNDYQHQVWCLRKKGALAQDLERERILVRSFNFESGLKISYLLRLIREAKKENFKIIHSHGIFPSIWAQLTAIFAKVSIRVMHCQNLYYASSVKERIRLRFLSCFTTKFIAVSQAVNKCLIGFIGIAPDKITLIYNSAPDLEQQTLDRKEEIRANLGLKPSDFVVGSISRLAELKGHIFIIEAIKELLKHNQNCKCIIAGDGPLRESLTQEVKNLGLEDKIIFLGQRKDAEDLYLAMDVFVLKSTSKEGLPLSLAEAASAGLPLIATAIGGNPEIVQDGVNGFIIPPKNSGTLAEKIEYLMRDPGTRKRMGENSRKIWQEKFTLQGMLNKIDSLYKDLMS